MEFLLNAIKIGLILSFAFMMKDHVGLNSSLYIKSNEFNIMQKCAFSCI
jgi:hypothetical protein